MAAVTPTEVETNYVPLVVAVLLLLSWRSAQKQLSTGPPIGSMQRLTNLYIFPMAPSMPRDRRRPQCAKRMRVLNARLMPGSNRQRGLSAVSVARRCGKTSHNMLLRASLIANMAIFPFATDGQLDSMRKAIAKNHQRATEGRPIYNIEVRLR